jgi:hypothetical protein
MNEDRNQDRHPQQQASVTHPDEWQQDLNPNHMAGQNTGTLSDDATRGERTALNLRKQGWNGGNLDDNELKQIPLVREGARLQQGATYVDLTSTQPHEFTATGEMAADGDHAYAPKDRVPYQIWNRLLGREKPGQGGRQI